MAAEELYAIRLPLPMDRGTLRARVQNSTQFRKELQLVGSLPHVVGYLHDLKSLVDDAVNKANAAAVKHAS